MPTRDEPRQFTIPGYGDSHTAHHTNYLVPEVGTVSMTPTDPVVAGSFAEFTIVFTAGRFGVDDTGSIRICTRQVSDVGRPQFTNPKAPNYVTAEASNGAKLSLDFNSKLAMRPWSRTLTVNVNRGFLAPGETITVRIGDRRFGSPGLRMQTYCEEAFHFLTLADVFATTNWALLDQQPTVRVVPGDAAAHIAVLPTQRRPGQAFALSLRADDVWGNPTDRIGGTFRLRPSAPVAGLPESFTWPEGARAHRIEGLTTSAGDIAIDWLDDAGRLLARTNPLRIAEAALLPYWADLHGQSGETVGTGTARQLASYARDLAFIDAMCHQGNDFQVSDAFWEDLNRTTAEFNSAGRFVFFPGYEWSGNTAIGGDRNVLLPEEGRPIRRSCRALVEDTSNPETDAYDARALHAAMRADGRPALCIPHVGGRYANLGFAHDKMLERAVEVHSDWGTFDWLLQDAFAAGGRVGIVAGSDGHKGRQGASHPGASQFGSYGGLTCILAEDLTRPALFEALRRRRHYATTSATRVLLDVKAMLGQAADRHIDDPALGGAPVDCTAEAGMGDILTGVTDTTCRFEAELVAASPIERIELHNRTERLEVIKPFAPADLGRRIRVVWEGSEYRGRGRETLWDGSVALTGNGWSGVTPINRWNVDKPFAADATSARFQAVTTGGFGGFDALLDDAQGGLLTIDTGLVKAELAIADIGFEDRVFEAGGLGRRIRVFRLPDENPHRGFRFTREVALRAAEDNAIFLRATLESGAVVWSSPIYLIRQT